MKSAPERSAPDRSVRTKQETSAGPGSAHLQAVPATAGWAAAGLGNRALLALHRAGRLQAKSRVGSPGDPREREADRAAEAVVAGAAARPEREARRAPDLAPAHTPGQGEQLVAPLLEPLGRGERLDEAVRGHMETRFGESFEDVRVHTGHHAHEANETLRARAFTVGADIVFGQGQYAPGTTEGRRLLAHELAHVVQQRRSTGAFADNRETERDAHEAAARVLDGGTPRVRERAAPGSVQRAPLTDVPADYGNGTGWGNSQGTIDWTITADGHDVVKAFRVPQSDPPRPRAWEDVDTKTLYVDPGTNGPNGLLGNGRWDQVLLTHGRPVITPPRPPTPPPQPKPKPKPKPAPVPKKPAPKPPTQPQPAPSSKFPEIPMPQVLPETVIGPEETDTPGAAAEPVVEADSRPVAEQVVSALESDPAKAAQLAPQLGQADLEQFTARDRAALLGALAAHAPGGLDVDTTLRILQSTPRNQQADLLERLVAHDGKVLADLRAAARPQDRGPAGNRPLADPDLPEPRLRRQLRRPRPVRSPGCPRLRQAVDRRRGAALGARSAVPPRSQRGLDHRGTRPTPDHRRRIALPRPPGGTSERTNRRFRSSQPVTAGQGRPDEAARRSPLDRRRGRGTPDQPPPLHFGRRSRPGARGVEDHPGRRQAADRPVGRRHRSGQQRPAPRRVGRPSHARPPERPEAPDRSGQGPHAALAGRPLPQPRGLRHAEAPRRPDRGHLRRTAVVRSGGLGGFRCGHASSAQGKCSMAEPSTSIPTISSSSTTPTATARSR
jgi:hypothetical protein